jgi:hypothetical protein
VKKGEFLQDSSRRKKSENERLKQITREQDLAN